jgi:hypothetical protein
MNMEFTSLFSFVTGMVFGSLFGAGLGAFVMFVNGGLSPYGPAGMVLPFQIVGMVIIGAVGGLYGRMAVGKLSLRNSIEPLVLGALLTFVYDIVTNVGTALFLNVSGLPFYEAFIIALVYGAVPSLLHIVWNTFLFAVVTIPLVNSMQRMLMQRVQV